MTPKQLLELNETHDILVCIISSVCVKIVVRNTADIIPVPVKDTDKLKKFCFKHNIDVEW